MVCVWTSRFHHTATGDTLAQSIAVKSKLVEFKSATAMVHRNVRFSANGKRPTKKIHWNSQRKCCHLLLVPDVLKDLARKNGVEVHPLDVVWVGFAARKQRSGQWRVVYFLDGLQTDYCFANQWGWMIVCLASVGELCKYWFW